MGHYKPHKRTTTRTSQTPEAWLGRCAEMGRLARNWSERQDLAIYGGEDSAQNFSVAGFYADTAEIEVNVDKAFRGKHPEVVGNLMDKSNWSSNAEAIGVIFHEACHAKNSANWNMKKLVEELDPAEFRAFMLLEEARIEFRGVQEFPEMATYLKLSALGFVLEGVSESSVRQESEVWSSAQTLVLMVGRIRSGILSKMDLPNVLETLSEVLGQELFQNLEEVAYEFMLLSVTQTNQAMELARKWVELLREADPEGEGNQGELSEGEEAEVARGTSSAMSEGDFSEKMKELMDNLAKSQELMEELDKRLKELEEQNEQAQSRSEANQKRAERKEIANVIFDKSHDQKGDGRSKSSVSETRIPSPDERAKAVQLGKALDKAKYRERSVTSVMRHNPSGRLKVKTAIQNKALEARGVRELSPEWKQKLRKHTDDPTLRLGIMVDVSGSMTNAMEAMGQTAWIVSEAGRRIQAKTSMVYFGEGVFPALRTGQRLDSINIYRATDGTEEFEKAWSATDGLLGLTWQDGVKVLVIVSDGQYRPDQYEIAVKTLRECKATGVTAIFVCPTGTYNGRAKQAVSEAGWGKVVEGIDDSEIPTAIGQAVTESMKVLERR